MNGSLINRGDLLVGFAQMHDQQSVKMERQIAEELMKVGKRWWGGGLMREEMFIL